MQHTDLMENTRILLALICKIITRQNKEQLEYINDILKPFDAAENSEELIKTIHELVNVQYRDIIKNESIENSENKDSENDDNVSVQHNEDKNSELVQEVTEDLPESDKVDEAADNKNLINETSPNNDREVKDGDENAFQNIFDELRHLEADLNKFSGGIDDPQYYKIDERLTKTMEYLDTLNTDANSELSPSREDILEKIKIMQELLERKADYDFKLKKNAEKETLRDEKNSNDSLQTIIKALDCGALEVAEDAGELSY